MSAIVTHTTISQTISRCEFRDDCWVKFVGGAIDSWIGNKDMNGQFFQAVFDAGREYERCLKSETKTT